MFWIRPCGHRFHLECISNWLCFHESCPTCRTDVCNIDKLRQLGLETKFYHTALLTLKYCYIGTEVTAYGNVFISEACIAVLSLLHNELLLNNIRFNQNANEIIRLSQTHLTPDRWSRALVGSDKHPPFKCVKRMLDSDGVQSETLTIREGAQLLV